MKSVTVTRWLAARSHLADVRTRHRAPAHQRHRRALERVVETRTPLPQWAANNDVELCYTPTYSSLANPIEAHRGLLREFMLNNSDHPNHTVLTCRVHAHLRWQDANARDPDLLAPQRRERARARSQPGRR